MNKSAMARSMIVLGSFLLLSFSVVRGVWAEPYDEELRQTIRDYIAGQQERQGAFLIVDERSGEVRQLELVRVHKRVGKTGDNYYSCTDMKDVATGDELDLDFDISDMGKALKVVAIRIHKDNGAPRYTYDDNDNLIPLPSPEG